MEQENNEKLNKTIDEQDNEEDICNLEPVFYILMRNDLNSLNAGKAIAQGSHAMQSFATIAEHPEIYASTIFNGNMNKKFFDLYKEWKTSTEQNYGTAIVLSVNKSQLENIIGNISYDCQNDPVYADSINDPTYPFIVENKEIAKLLTDNNENINIINFLEDGKVIMQRPETTCGYIFCDKNNEIVKKQLELLELY